MFYIEKLNEMVENLFTEALMELNDLQIWMWRCVGGNGCVLAFGKSYKHYLVGKNSKLKMQCFSWVVMKLEVFNCDETWCKSTCEDRKMHKKQNIF